VAKMWRGGGEGEERKRGDGKENQNVCVSDVYVYVCTLLLLHDRTHLGFFFVTFCHFLLLFFF
jgi:hypothetical protein